MILWLGLTGISIKHLTKIIQDSPPAWPQEAYRPRPLPGHVRKHKKKMQKKLSKMQKKKCKKKFSKMQKKSEKKVVKNAKKKKLKKDFFYGPPPRKIIGKYSGKILEKKCWQKKLEKKIGTPQSRSVGHLVAKFWTTGTPPPPAPKADQWDTWWQNSEQQGPPPKADQLDTWWQNSELQGPPPPPCGQTEILKTLPSLKLRLRAVNIEISPRQQIVEIGFRSYSYTYRGNSVFYWSFIVWSVITITLWLFIFWGAEIGWRSNPT